MSFSVGDRVRLTEEGVRKGSEGTVKEILGSQVDVEGVGWVSRFNVEPISTLSAGLAGELQRAVFAEVQKEIQLSLPHVQTIRDLADDYIAAVKTGRRLSPDDVGQEMAQHIAFFYRPAGELFGYEPLFPGEVDYASIEPAQRDFDSDVPFKTPFQGMVTRSQLLVRFPKLTRIMIRFGIMRDQTGTLITGVVGGRERT